MGHGEREGTEALSWAYRGGQLCGVLARWSLRSFWQRGQDLTIVAIAEMTCTRSGRKRGPARDNPWAIRIWSTIGPFHPTGASSCPEEGTNRFECGVCPGNRVITPESQVVSPLFSQGAEHDHLAATLAHLSPAAMRVHPCRRRRSR